MSRNKGRVGQEKDKKGNQRKLKKRGRIITVDLDGTVADISKRRELALEFGEEKSPVFYEVLLDPSHFHLDQPVPSARDFLTAYVAETGGEVHYLSGRRVGTESASLEWLTQHGFPSGPVIHRKTGKKSADFKKQYLTFLAAEFRVDGHFGDREVDDRGSAEAVGIPYFHIDGYAWPVFSEVRSLFLKLPSISYIDFD